MVLSLTGPVPLATTTTTSATVKYIKKEADPKVYQVRNDVIDFWVSLFFRFMFPVFLEDKVSGFFGRNIQLLEVNRDETEV